MKTKNLAVGALAGLCLVASQASATVVTVTVTGTVNSLFFSSAWGTNPFSSISEGDAFKAVYTFDTTQAGVDTSDSIGRIAYGGSLPGFGSFGHAEVTVGDLNYSFDGNYFGRIYSNPIGLGQDTIFREGTVNTYDYIGLNSSEAGTFPHDFTEPGVYNSGPSDSWFAGMDVESMLDGTYNSAGLLGVLAQRVEITNDAPNDGGGSNGNSVPEPASLALFAAGLMAAPLFRRRSSKHPMVCA